MRTQRRFIVDILFVLALFAIFTLSALILVTIGADVYKHTVEDMSSNYDTRTSVAYITEKIRQNDSIYTQDGIDLEDNIIISTLDDVPVLKLTQDVNGEAYCTYLYYYDGYLKELFIMEGRYLGDNMLEAGQNIMPINSLSFERVSDNLFVIYVSTAEHDEQKILVSTHSNIG